MYNPSQADVRQFFCSVYAKWLSQSAMEPLETIAALWIAAHPEYHGDLSDPEAALEKDYSAGEGKGNPFLHLSMHLSITEQCSIDQPQGVRAAVEQLTAKFDSLHEAHHKAMDALGEMLWQSQRMGAPPDGASYVNRLQEWSRQSCGRDSR